MAITKDSFQNIPTKGDIPEDMLPATAWAVSYVFAYPLLPGDAPSKTLFANLRLLVKDSTNATKYVITVEERFFYVLMSLSPGLPLFTWQWLPQFEKIEGRKGEAPDAETMQTLGKGTFGMEPAQGSGAFTDATIFARYYSVIFQEPLERGDRLILDKYTIGILNVKGQAALQLATEVGEDISCALRDPRVGTVWHVAPDGEEGARIANTRRDAAFERKVTSLVTERKPIFARAIRHGATMHFVMVYAVKGGTTLGVLTSLDGGATWENNDMLLDNFEVLAARLAEDGGTMWLYGLVPVAVAGSNTPQKVPSRAVLKRGDDGWKASGKAAVQYPPKVQEGLDDPAQAAPTPLPRKGVVTLEASGDTLHLVAQGDKGGAGANAKTPTVRMWESTDELLTLRELTISDDTEAATDE